jgi:hypothetical protein
MYDGLGLKRRRKVVVVVRRRREVVAARKCEAEVRGGGEANDGNGRRREGQSEGGRYLVDTIYTIH